MFHVFNPRLEYVATFDDILDAMTRLRTMPVGSRVENSDGVVMAVRAVPCAAGQVSKRLAIENAFRTNQKYAAGLVAMLNVEAA